MRGTSFTILALIRELDFGLIVPWFGRKKFGISRYPAGVWRFRVTNLARCALAWAKKFFRRVSARHDLTSVWITGIDRARCEVAFRYKPSSRLGVANS